MKNKTKQPKVSIVICTYNNKELVKRCLDSVFNQDYKNIEVICADGGSTDGTLQLLKNYKVKIINNKKRFPEGKGMGKDQGSRAAKGDFILFIDQDNKLISKNIISNLAFPLIKDKEILGSACFLFINKEDNITNRYLSYVGTDPFASYRSIEGRISLNKIKLNDEGNYYTYLIKEEDNMCTGGNVFLVRNSFLKLIGGYVQDVDMINSFIKKGINKLAIPKNTFTHHLTTSSFLDFLKKRWKWGLHYQQKNKSDRDYSWSPLNTKDYRFYLEVLKNITLIFNIPIALKKLVQTKDTAWILHPIASFLVTLEYILIYIFY